MSANLAQIIEDFIQKRLKDKLDKLKSDDPKRQQLLNEHQPINWLDDAARRAKWIKLVTHASKFHHPDAKGSSLHISKQNQVSTPFVSSYTLEKPEPDVVGNAAALDVFKFLQLLHNDETILDRVLRQDAELLAALPGVTEQKKQWLAAFASIKDADAAMVSHSFAKQVYFPVGENQYRLLSPLFPSSLVHAVYKKIQEAQFSETAKASRIAKKTEEFHEQGHQDFLNLAIQKFGGSKPQNISQLNSTRGGKAYLLASCPPLWKSETLKPPLTGSILVSEFDFRTKRLINELKIFLNKNKQHNNKKIRMLREDLVSKIFDIVLMYGCNIQALDGGWTKKENCNLTDIQKFWLDPKRAQNDPLFQLNRERSDWRAELAGEISHWFNGHLRKVLDTQEIGQPEYIEWKAEIESQLNLMVEGFE